MGIILPLPLQLNCEHRFTQDVAVIFIFSDFHFRYSFLFKIVRTKRRYTRQ
jgi:hypothetical protein